MIVYTFWNQNCVITEWYNDPVQHTFFKIQNNSCTSIHYNRPPTPMPKMLRNNLSGICLSSNKSFIFFRGGCVGPSHKTVGGGVFSIECVFASILKSGKRTGLHTNTHLSYHLISYCHTSGHSKIFYMTTMNHFNRVTICTPRIQINLC